jgi:hypothetical protein
VLMPHRSHKIENLAKFSDQHSATCAAMVQLRHAAVSFDP